MKSLVERLNALNAKPAEVMMINFAVACTAVAINFLVAATAVVAVALTVASVIR